MAKPLADTSKPEPVLEYPTEGGSYTRHPDTKELVPSTAPTEVPALPAPSSKE